ncbi:MAG: GGDEF domain-containing protein [Geothrix sp.]|uniref:GGDEF domain-containing protein n=1 Tax=Geothrix sp. TaxID=1962974 RepID=UPI00184E1DA8|nr:GGDEF domain-containing protein [Geothrix sp.]NWJ41799.1 GGDEF domain-containing protein [Geothrix sp.]WIL20223.1 MAG: GGDEF domain-containing protein [Geothrix sp.]
MPLEHTPPDLPPWDPASVREDAELLGELDTREWVLIRYVGQPMGEFIPLPLEGLSIGRAPENGLCLPEPEVSRRHARLNIAADLETVELRDLGSTNGVFINGKRVYANPGPLKLRAEDVVRVGGHAFKLKHMDALERRYHQAMVARTTLDPLTGVGNRATVLHQLESHFDLARRHRRPLAVILADLDWFKQVNDTHGHRAGDRALESFGALLHLRLRGSDPVGRLGGDEFLIVLPETSVMMALNAAEGLRRALAEHPLELEGGLDLRLTCSLGVAELKDGDSDGGALLARADAALYGAKAGGRDRAYPAP